MANFIHRKFLWFEVAEFQSTYSAFQVDEPHRHKQNPVGTLHAKSLLWSTVQENCCNIANQSKVSNQQ
ncbi:MAG: hypothetical protein AB4080_15885 [Trichodesmium sp.]